jgi:hypothetical protein
MVALPWLLVRPKRTVLFGSAVGRANKVSAVAFPSLLALLPGLGRSATLLVEGSLGLAAIEDGSDRLLAGGMVCRKVKEILGGLGLEAAQFLDQGLPGSTGEQSPDNVCVDDVGKVVALLGEASDVLTQSLTVRLLAALEIPRVARSGIGALKVSHEHLLKLSPIANAIGWKVFEPSSRSVYQEDRQVLDDKVVIISTTSPTGEPVVF